MRMIETFMPIGKFRTDCCRVLDNLKPGEQVVVTSNGQPKAVISAYRKKGPPLRRPQPVDPKLYGDIQSPVLEALE